MNACFHLDISSFKNIVHASDSTVRTSFTKLFLGSSFAIIASAKLVSKFRMMILVKRVRCSLHSGGAKDVMFFLFLKKTIDASTKFVLLVVIFYGLYGV